MVSSLRHRQSAFTLIEILVAVSIIAIALVSMMKSSGGQAANTGYLKEKTIGLWVATNELNQLTIEQQWPSPGTSRDSVEMANHTWYWQQEVERTPSDDTYKVIIKVYSDSDMKHKVSTLTGYLTNPRFLVTTGKTP